MKLITRSSTQYRESENFDLYEFILKHLCCSGKRSDLGALKLERVASLLLRKNLWFRLY